MLCVVEPTMTSDEERIIERGRTQCSRAMAAPSILLTSRPDFRSPAHEEAGISCSSANSAHHHCLPALLWHQCRILFFLKRPWSFRNSDIKVGAEAAKPYPHLVPALHFDPCGTHGTNLMTYWD